MKRRSYGRDTGLTLRMLFTSGLLGLLYVVFAVVLFRSAQRRTRADAGDRRRPGRVPVLHVRQAGAALPPARRSSRARRRPRCTTWSSGCARWPTCRSRGSRSWTRRCRTRSRPAVRRSMPRSASRPASGTASSRRRSKGVLAHELSHIANRDVLIMTVASFFAMLAAMLTRFGLYARHVGRRRRPSRQQRPAGLADHARGLDRRLRDQLRPDPHDLALPRVLRRPRLGPDHRRAGVPDERPAEDLVADDAHPEQRPARRSRA